MSASRFEKEYLPEGSQSSLARIFVNDMLPGHVPVADEITKVTKFFGSLN